MPSITNILRAMVLLARISAALPAGSPPPGTFIGTHISAADDLSDRAAPGTFIGKEVEVSTNSETSSSSAPGTFIGMETESSDLTAKLELSNCAADGSGLESCPSTLPPSFCCPKGTSCVSLAGASTVLCCPDGQDCAKIRPITCALSQQDASENPKAPIKTTLLDGELPSCGKGTCCPFGYSCDGDLCVKDKDQSQRPVKPSSTTSAATASTTSAEIVDTTAVPSVVPTTVPAADSSSTESASTSGPTSDDGDDQGSDSSEDGNNNESQDSGPDTAALIGGVIGGLACLVIIAVLAWLCYRRQKKRTYLANQEKAAGGAAGRSPRPPPSSLSHKRNVSSIGHISEPIVQSNSFRTDFIRKPSSEANHNNSGNNSNGSSDGDRRSSRPTTRFPVNPSAYWNTIDGGQDQTQSQTRQQNGQQPPPPRISIPNPFDSPNLSATSPSPTSGGSDDGTNNNGDPDLRHGTVSSGARLAPIRAMKASSRHLRPAGTGPGNGYLIPRKQPSGESINVFADPRGMMSGGNGRDDENRLTRNTTFTQMMDDAKLGDVHRGRPYVPVTTPRI